MHRPRVAHERRRLRQRRAHALVAAVVVVGVLAASGVLATVRPDPVTLPVVEVNPVMPPVGGFGVPAAETSATLVAMLPPGTSEPLADSSYVERYSVTGRAPGDTPAGAAAVRVGTASYADGDLGAVVRVEVRRAVPGQAECSVAAPRCLAGVDGAVVTRLPASTDPARGERSRGVVATWPGVVQVRVEEFVVRTGRGARLPLSSAQLASIAQSPIWRG